MDSRVILCLNSGSSSLKFALYQIGDREELLLAQGTAELNDERVARLWIHSAGEKVEKTGSEISSASTPLYAPAIELKRLRLPHPEAVGHRLVHGGPHHGNPERITDTLFNELSRLIPFAPLHLPDEIAGIEAVTSNFPSLRRSPASTLLFTARCRKLRSASHCRVLSGTKAYAATGFMEFLTNTSCGR